MLLNNISKLLARRDILPARLIGFMLGISLLCVFPKASADFLTQTAIGETIPSTLDEGDFPYNGKLFEVYSFEGVKGQEIFINLSSFAFDPILWLVNSQGQFIAFDDDSGDGMGAMISRFSLPETGIYFPAVGSAGEFGAYTLSLNQAPWVNYSGGPLEEIFIGDQVSGNLTDSSAQWSTGQYFNAYQFEAEPGQAISIVMRSEQFNTYLWLLDHQGKVITVNGNKIIFFPSTSGNYFIAASSSLPLEKGAYSLILETTHQPTQAKALSGTVSEKLETADFQLSTGQYLDVYTFQGAMDEHVSIGLKSSEFDSYLRILDSAGNVLREDDDSAGGQDALIEDFVLPDTGQYFVWISSVFAGGIGPYSLSFNDVSPRRIKTKDTIKLVLSHKGNKLRGKAEPFANSSRCLGSLETYTAKVNICNRENESHSGSISLSGPSDIIISPGTMDFTLPPHTCTTKSPFYITTASATTGVKTITAEAQIGENIGSDSEDLHVVKVEVFRDANFTQPLTDWPASGGNPRSPRFLFASDDPIYVQVTGLGKNPSQQETISDAIHVFSETDPTGIPLTLTETGVNTDVFRNSGDLLFLSSESSQGAQKKIKVVDEEILSFKPSNKSCFDVMVDRAEFSSNGIHIFYGSPTGDRAIVRTEALTNTKFFDAGDTDFPSVGAGEPMRTFIKNVGSDQPGDGEADIMHVSSHGNADGALWDDASNVILNPATHISNSSDLNLDAEWLVLAACSTLNQWGGGKDAWLSAMNGNPRGLHGVLGAEATISDDLQDVYQGFWERMRQGYTIKDAYAAAMELDNPTPEPWAVIHHSANGGDKLKEFTQDIQTQSRSRASSGISYSFLDTKTVICDQVGSCEEGVKDSFDNGNGIVRVDFPPLLPSQKNLAIQQKMYPVRTKSRLPFAQKVSRKQDGRTVFEGELLFDAESTLSEQGAISLAEDLIRQYFPELVPQLKLKEVSVRKSKGDRTKVNGYIVQFDLFNGALPILGDHIRVSIFGDQYGAASLLYHQNTGNLPGTGNSKELLEALTISRNDIIRDLGIKGKYEILDAGLWYVKESKINPQGSDTTFLPVWRLVFNPNYQGEGSHRSELYEVYLDLITGGYIGKISFEHR